MLHYDSHIATKKISADIFAMPVLDSRMYLLDLDDELMIVDPNLLADEDESVFRKILLTSTSDKATDSTRQPDFDHIHILLTHSHYDHIAGLNSIRSLVPPSALTVHATSLCDEKMRDPRKNLSAYSMALVMGKTPERQAYCEACFDFDYRCEADVITPIDTSLGYLSQIHNTGEASSTAKFSDTETADIQDISNVKVNSKNNFIGRILSILTIGSYSLKTIYTPGHSDCSVCIELWQDKSDLLAVFTGDSLVNGHDVITRFPTGNKRIYQEYTYPYLRSLPEETLIFPGHGDPSVLAELIEYART